MPAPFLPLLLLGASLCFALGVALPLMEIDRLYFFTTTPSLIEVTTGLWANGDRAIAIITALFSLIFPLAKLAVLHMAAFAAAGAPAVPSWFKALARWSMLDVLVVALIIFAAKTSGLASAAARPGLWFFALSVVLTAAASSAAARRQPPTPPPAAHTI